MKAINDAGQTVGEGQVRDPISFEESQFDEEIQRLRAEREERRRRDRRERFALAIYRTLAADAGRLPDWHVIAKKSVEAADALEKALTPVLPEDGGVTKTPLTVEQMCRDLLAQAIADRLFDFDYIPDPQSLTAGELCGMANLLAKFLMENRAPRAAG